MTILILIIGLAVGFILGANYMDKKKRESMFWDKSFEKDLENLQPPEMQRILFTNKERYEFGKAYVLKKNMKEAKEKLDRIMSTLIGIELDKKYEQLKREGKI